MSKVRCANPACRLYRDKETCVRFGLSWCCDRDCLYQAAITRRKVPEWKQPAPGARGDGEGARGDLDDVSYNARSRKVPGVAGKLPSPSQLPATKTLPSQRKRRAILKRDGRACRSCGTTTNLHVHHIVYRSEGGGHIEGNLVTLCFSCHDLVHSDKHRFQPALKEMMRQHYQLATFVMLPEALRLASASKESDGQAR